MDDIVKYQQNLASFGRMFNIGHQLIMGVQRLSWRSERTKSSDAENQVLVQSAVLEVLQVLSTRTILF